MNLRSLPDIVAMLILMGVLESLRRRHRDSSVTLWMLGLTFILLEAFGYAIVRGASGFSNLAHALALDSYVLAAVTFGWASREDVLPEWPQLPIFFPPAVPLFLLTTLYGFSKGSVRVYLYVTSASLVLGAIYLLIAVRSRPRFRLRLLAEHTVLWAPMTWMALTGQLRLLIYWGLATLYLMVAISFRRRVRRDGVGGIVIVSGFTVWAICFLVHPFVRNSPLYNDVNEQIWTMQKFFVIIGMLLVLLEEQTRRLKEEALHDALTGLPNRRLFEDRLMQALERARRTERSAALFVVDLDNFKQVNDTYGHRSGDEVLAKASEQLKGKIRAMDTLARCGGDEFNIVVNDLTTIEDCERIAEALRASIAVVEMPEGSTDKLRASVGFAVFPDEATAVDALAELADLRMYRDKRRPPELP
jgi:diguanylate cyclase (GGDEF)-like protein